jgi:hypothetical protein
MTTITDVRKIGNRVVSAVVPLIAVGAANALNIFAIPALAGVLNGTQSAIIKKITLKNNAAGNTTVIFGTGIPGVAAMPALDSINALTDVYNEEDISSPEFFANITAYATALGAGGSVDVQIEVLIRG